MAKGGAVQYRVDPKSGNRISALGLGCMRFPGAPGRPDAKTADAIISRAVEQGINYLDTAYLYPGNEACVGASLERLGLRDRVLLATKLPHASCKCAEDFDRFFDEQLRRLRTDHIDYYLMHNITSPAQWERVVALGIEDWIACQKAAGRIRQIGFSYHGSAADFLTMLDAYDWDFCQIQYNYLDTDERAEEDEGRGRTVENGHFRRIQIDPAIVDAQPAEGRHQVFDGPHLDSVHFETGAHAGIANQHGLGGNILGLGQIDATEDDAGIRGCRAQGQVDLDAAMQADT